jgi:hypothetical protein
LADEELDCDGMLSALQALLGEYVTVSLDVQYDSGRRPLATLRGVLNSGEVGDLSEAGGTELGYPAGEAFAFFVGAEPSFFFLREDDFERGRREGKALIFATGRARVYVLAI